MTAGLRAQQVVGRGLGRPTQEGLGVPASAPDAAPPVNPRVVVSGDMGVLTFNFVSQVKGRTVRWDTTEVYRGYQS